MKKQEQMENPYDEIKNKILKLFNSDGKYTLEDFNSEYSPNNDITPIKKIENNKLLVNFENHSNNPDPEFSTNGSSGFDIRANLLPNSPIVLNNGERCAIPTGLYFQIPENFELQIRPRSGLAYNYGITVLNSPGTIDSDYRGEVKVILINHGSQFIVNNGDRIAQGVITPIVSKNNLNLLKVNKISDKTDRDSGGFGHTGIK